MLKTSRKHSKRLAKLVLAALMCTGGAHGLIGPSVAEASELTVTGMTNDSGYVFTPAGSLVYEGPYAYIPADRGVTILNLAAGENDKWDSTIAVVGHYSGYGSSDNVSGYSVNVTGVNTKLGELYGGVADSGIASGNKVTVSDGTIYPFSYYSVAVAGGVSYLGNAVENEVVIDGGTIGYGGGSAGSGGLISSDSGEGIAGGLSYKGNATGNKLTIEGNAKVSSNVYGGVTGENYSYYYVAAGGDASSNTVTINASASVIPSAYGGRSIGGNADGNTLNVNSGIVYYAIGGNAVPARSGGVLRASIEPDTSTETVKEGSATGNTVNISGDAQAYVVVGGASVPFLNLSPVSASSLKGTGVANNNTVNISGGKLGFTRTIDEIGKTVNTGSVIYGGASYSEASGNTVTISGGDMEGTVVIGGMVETLESRVSIEGLEGSEPESTASEAKGKTDNNTVNILTPVNAGGLFGGLIFEDLRKDYNLRSGSGNTLNLAAKNVSTFTIGGFQNMNFYLPKDIANGDTMLTIKTPKTIYDAGIAREFYLLNKFELPKEGEESYDEEGNILLTPKPTDLTGVTFGVAALSGVNLEVGNTVNLIVDENGLKTDDALKTADSKELGKAEFLAANNMSTDDSYGMSISKQGSNAIIATVESKTSLNNEDRHKSAAETRESVVTLVNTAADLLAGQGLSNASDAAGAAGGRMEPFAAIGGSNLRAESGSHVTTKGFGLNLGFAKEIKNKSGKLLIGPMVEYGHGRYDSYQDDGTKADGKSHYWGIGVLAKQTNNNGLYYEGSLRVGRTGSDYTRNEDANLPNYHADYDSKSTYWGAHLGIGKVMDIGHKNTLDYYGKYFYSHTGGDTTTMHTNVFGDVETRFDSVNSHRLRLGARVTHALNEKNKFYGGLAWQYEFNGDAKVSYSTGGAAPSPSVKGSSGMIELGWQVKPGKSPMVIDLGVTGWVGKQRGVTANLQANWTF